MNTSHDFESLAYVNWNNHAPAIMEAYKGEDIVRWWGKIERQLQSLLADAEKSRNYPFSEKLRGYLTVWRDNQLTGSINVEDLKPLESAADMLARDTWTLGSYFGSLRDSLRVLQASEEALPRGNADQGNDPLAGGGGGGIGGGGPPMAPDFGPEGEMGGEEGAPGGGGGPGGGAADTAGGPEGGAGGLPSPEELMQEPDAGAVAAGGGGDIPPGGIEGEGGEPDAQPDEDILTV